MLNKLKHQFSTKTCTLLLSFIVFFSISIVALHFKTELSQTLQQADILWITAGIGCYLINYLSRAYRIRYYSQQELRLLPDTLRITCLHGFATYFFPLRSGDLTMPALLRLYHQVPLLVGSRILLRARLLDILTLGILLISATIFSAPETDKVWRIIFILVGLSFLGLPYLLITLVNHRQEWLAKILMCFADSGNVRITYPSGKEIGQSLLIWFWTGCTIFCVIRSLKIPLAFLDVWFFTTIQLPLQLLPIQGFANSGNHEAGWMITLNLLGATKENTIAIALSSHIILIVYVLLLGAVGAILPYKKTIHPVVDT